MTVHLEYIPQHERPRPRSGGRRIEKIAIPSGFFAVSDEEWKILESNDTVKQLRKFNALKILSAEDLKAQKELEQLTQPKQINLGDLQGDDVDNAIDSTTDTVTLERWLQAEQRKTVQVKLKAKIQELKGG